MHTASTEYPVAVSGKKEISACSRLQTPTSKTLCIPKISCVCVAVLRGFVVVVVVVVFQMDLTVCFMRILILVFISLSINVSSKRF